MKITNKTTIKDVEGHPFIGVVDMTMFIHPEMDEVSYHNPFNFREESKLVLKTRPISVTIFRGDYRDLVSNTKAKCAMVYFLSTIDNKIVHKDAHGEYVRMAQVKLTKYDFNRKVQELVIKRSESNVIETPQKNYMYLLIN